VYPINEAVNLKMQEVMISSVIPTFEPSHHCHLQFNNATYNNSSLANVHKIKIKMVSSSFPTYIELISLFLNHSRQPCKCKCHQQQSGTAVCHDT